MADLALYHAKYLGRNRYAVFEPALAQVAAEKHLLENELRQASLRMSSKCIFSP